MLSAVAITRLEKAATDNGFDLELEHTSDWLSFGSSQTSMRIWLTGRGESRFLAAMSRSDVLKGLDDRGVVFTDLLPSGAGGAASVRDIAALHRLLRRAFQLSRTLPDALLQVFENEIANLPRTTEAERMVVRRVGQDIFRRGLLEYWDGRCAITGLDVPDLLRASHIKPLGRLRTRTQSASTSSTACCLRLISMRRFRLRLSSRSKRTERCSCRTPSRPAPGRPSASMDR